MILNHILSYIDLLFSLRNRQVNTIEELKDKHKNGRESWKRQKVEEDLRDVECKFDELRNQELEREEEDLREKIAEIKLCALAFWQEDSRFRAWVFVDCLSSLVNLFHVELKLERKLWWAIISVLQKKIKSLWFTLIRKDLKPVICRSVCLAIFRQLKTIIRGKILHFSFHFKLEN